MSIHGDKQNGTYLYDGSFHQEEEQSVGTSENTAGS